MKPVSQTIAFILTLLVGLWSIWLLWAAFFGGIVWVPFGSLIFEDVNIVRGLFWLFIGEPILLTVAYWLFMLIMLPISLIEDTLSNKKIRE